jgi:2-polyprenyl-3-methyl-5-hydroxy-6-metoxy-1,4-benzoquinol methylase
MLALMPEIPTLASATCWICGSTAQPDARLGSDGYLRCEQCGLMFQGWRTTGEAARMYDDTYFRSCAGGGGYLDDDPQRTYEASRRIMFLRRFVEGGRLLEIGSAGGHFLDQACVAGFHVRGIEPVAAVAMQAAERFGVEVEHGTIEHSQLGHGAWDVVCAFHVLEHLQDPLQALAKVHVALADGGQLVLEVPNIASALAHRYGSRWFNLQPSHHVAHYDPGSLRAALNQSGFVVRSLTTVPHFEYVRPRSMLRVQRLKALGALVLASRTVPFREHPHAHEFIRAVAVKSN